MTEKELKTKIAALSIRLSDALKSAQSQVKVIHDKLYSLQREARSLSTPAERLEKERLESELSALANLTDRLCSSYLVPIISGSISFGAIESQLNKVKDRAGRLSNNK